MILNEMINKCTEKINGEISINCADLLKKYPIELYISDVKSYGESCNYKYFSPRIKSIFNEILTKYNAHIFALYQKMALSAFIKDSIERLHDKDIPESILLIYQEWFKRVLNDFSIQPDDFYHYENDAFQKDFSVCSLRLYPVGGSWVVDSVGAMDRNHLFAGGIRQFFKCLKFVLFKTGGRKPFYIAHIVDRYVDKYSPQERVKCNIKIAELLKRNPKMKGLMAGAWLLDPQIEQISPHLAWVRQGVEQNGAEIFRIGIIQSHIELALLKSSKRRKLYEEGKYIPVFYGYVWPRKALIAWADKQTSKA